MRVGKGIRKLGHRNAVSNVSRAANGNASQVPHQVETKSHRISAASVSKPGKPTGDRILQLNMQRSAVVTGEVRQLIAEKRIDALLLQEPYAGKLGWSGNICGLGLGVSEATARSQYPWAAVAICNHDYEICFVSQLSNSHCHLGGSASSWLLILRCVVLLSASRRNRVGPQASSESSHCPEGEETFSVVRRQSEVLTLGTTDL